jgi:flavin reductase (DIM6/NTAB) family NADH-FMN oxidoreductase RutF
LYLTPNTFKKYGIGLANIECRVTDYIEKHNIFILDAVHAWINSDRKERRMIHANGDGTFVVDGRTISYRKLMMVTT